MSSQQQADRGADRGGSRSIEGRKKQIEDLRREQSPRSVSLLLETLCDESWMLRELAIKALVETPDLAAPHLITLLESGLWYTRAAAVHALGLMAYAPAIQTILRLLDDGNQMIAIESARALLALARQGHAVTVARGILSRGGHAEESLVALETVDPDAGRKIRILTVRDDVGEPVRTWLAQDEPDPEVLERELLTELDDAYGVSWEDISGPVSR